MSFLFTKVKDKKTFFRFYVVGFQRWGNKIGLEHYVSSKTSKYTSLLDSADFWEIEGSV